MKIAAIVGTAAVVLAGSWVAWANMAGPGGGRQLAAAASLQAIAGGNELAAAELLRNPTNASSGLAFVINSNEASISLIDVGTRQELRRIPVLREPHHMALTPDHRLLLVGDTAGNEMLFLNPTTGDVEKRMTISDPYQFGFSPDGKWLVVNGLLRNQIDIYDAATMQLASRVPVSSMPSHLNFSPDRGPPTCHCNRATAWLPSTSPPASASGNRLSGPRPLGCCGTTVSCWLGSWVPISWQ